jgi:hypothetical protein
MALGNQRRPSANQFDVHGSTAASAFSDRFAVLDEFNCVPIPGKHFSEPVHFVDSRGVGRLAKGGRDKGKSADRMTNERIDHPRLVDED